MRKCKNCGVELQESGFEFYFSDEALAELLCDTCIAKEKELKAKIIDLEEKKHPEWYGPTKLHEL